MTLSGWVILLLVPPINLALIALAAVLLRRLRLAAACLGLLVVLGVPQVADRLRASLDVRNTGRPALLPQAVVVLGADVTVGIRADGQPAAVAGPLTLARLQAGVAAARRTGLPVLVTGGIVNRRAPAVGTLMAQAMREDFGLAPRWVEDRSADTWGNAQLSAALLHPAGVRTVLLVTDGWHMRRAALAFRRARLDVVAAPVLWDAAPPLTFASFMPGIAGWVASYDALHEWVGWAWYGVR